MFLRLSANVLLGAMISTCALAGAAPQAFPADNGSPANWQSYDVLVHLIALPQRYSCDQLWTKFRAVLIGLGAGRVNEVTPEDCDSNSPSVHVRFVLPRQVYGAAAQYPDINAALRTVELSPGNPAQLQQSDCRLVQQMQESLLFDLPLKVVSARFDCTRNTGGAAQGVSSASSKPQRSYVLQVRGLMPIWPKQTVTAAAAPKAG